MLGEIEEFGGILRKLEIEFFDILQLRNNLIDFNNSQVVNIVFSVCIISVIDK